MEARLAETLAEARRHHKSYMDIREQYNNFVEGRINSMITNLLGGTTKTPGKATKVHLDAIQTLKVNLEAQMEKLQDEKK
jgi:hypothetical protein